MGPVERLTPLAITTLASEGRCDGARNDHAVRQGRHVFEAQIEASWTRRLYEARGMLRNRDALY